MRSFLILITLLGSVFFLNAQPTLIQQSSEVKGSMSIPFSKYRLANGLTVIIHEDKSDPIVHVDVTYHVGSNREEPGKSGFAHFFEHMMFQGSKNVADDEHFKIINEIGGTMNGSTNFDRTNYFETIPSNQLEVALWLEADRMGFLLDSVTSPKFEIQRATVKNERGQNYDNKPYGRNREKVNQALYPYGHPYSWPTIGWMEDIDRADLNDLRRFFLTYYGPNNAVLTIAGNVQTDRVLPLVEKYFGTISAGPKVDRVVVPPFEIKNDRYISYTDNVRSPMFHAVFPTVPIYHEDEIALDALSEIMGGTAKNSFLYKSFIKTSKAIRVRASHPTSELAGQFSFTITANPNTPLAEMDKLLQVSLMEFDKIGVTQEQVNTFIKGHESTLYNSLSSVSGKASILAYYETFTGDADFIAKDQLRYRELTAEKIMEVFRKYILNQASVKLSVVSEEKRSLIAADDNFKVNTKNNSIRDISEVKPAQADMAELVANTQVIEEAHALTEEIQVSKEVDETGITKTNVDDKFDRSKRPTSDQAPVLKTPLIWKEKIAENIPVFGIQNSENPIITAQIRFAGGHRLSALDLSKAGISEFTARMLQEGTKTQTAEEIAERLGALGSNINISSDETEVRYSVQCLSSELNSTIEILKDMMLNPLFDESAFGRIKKQILETIESQQTQAAVLADNAFYSSIYKQGSIQSISQIGTIKTIESIKIEDVMAFHKSWFNSTNCSVIISGDIDKSVAQKAFSFLGKLPTTKSRFPEESLIKPVSKTEIIFINKSKAPQSEIRIGYPALAYDAYGEYYKTSVMNYALGGSFSSRINLNLREDKGYTYGARSRFIGDKWKGVFLASAGVKASVTDSAIYEFMKEIKLYSDKGITKKELEFTVNSWGQSEALKYETPNQSLAVVRRIADYALESNYMTQQAELRKKLSVSEVNQLAKKNLPYEKMLIIVVGDKEKVLPSLKWLGYPITEIRAE